MRLDFARHTTVRTELDGAGKWIAFSVRMSRVFLAGDNPTSLAMLRDLFEAHSEFSLCGESLGTDEIIVKAERLKPHLVILDFAHWSWEGLPLAEALRQKLPGASLFLFTERRSFDLEREATLRGIDAVFAKDEGLEPLLANARAACGLDSLGHKNGNRQ